MSQRTQYKLSAWEKGWFYRNQEIPSDPMRLHKRSHQMAPATRPVRIQGQSHLSSKPYKKLSSHPNITTPVAATGEEWILSGACQDQRMIPVAASIAYIYLASVPILGFNHGRPTSNFTFRLELPEFIPSRYPTSKPTT